jgi:hypothetical protein
MTVYTVHPLRLDHIANMADWGSIVPINMRFIFPDELRADNGLPPAFVDNMVQAAKQFHHDTDYLVMSGDQLQISAMSAILAAYHGSFSVLKFERREAAYFPARIDSGLVLDRRGVLQSRSQTGVTNGKDSSEGRGSDAPRRLLTSEAIANVLPKWGDPDHK